MQCGAGCLRRGSCNWLSAASRLRTPPTDKGGKLKASLAAIDRQGMGVSQQATGGQRVERCLNGSFQDRHRASATGDLNHFTVLDKPNQRRNQSRRAPTGRRRQPKTSTSKVGALMAHAASCWAKACSTPALGWGWVSSDTTWVSSR